MKLDNKKIRLIGKSRALVESEIKILLSNLESELIDGDDFDILIEGAMVNPIDANRLDLWYKNGKTIFSLDTLGYKCSGI